MPTCSAPRCSTGKGGSKNKGSRQFPFPSNVIQRNRWIRQLKLDPRIWIPQKRDFVCELHFEERFFKAKHENIDKKGRPFKRKNLTEDAVPTLFKHKNSDSYSLRRYAQAKKKDKKKGKKPRKEPKPREFIPPGISFKNYKKSMA